eukprot:TRINITY_DN2810_c1_g3_i1.p1 TRINITY_DN2810_c1_g3~~TRINITY_DN2810_c1_g3_i1.p1  ORF type:complete len:219 (+),score=37.38 TRINITY_DN2810_c1_g3_i1:79-735(+)
MSQTWSTASSGSWDSSMNYPMLTSSQPSYIGSPVPMVHNPYLVETPESSSCGSEQEVASGRKVVVQFKFGRTGRYEFSKPQKLHSYVVVEGDRGMDLGMVAGFVDENSDVKFGKGLRKATDKEATHWTEAVSAEEADARRIVQEMIRKHKVPMRVVHAEFQFDMRKLTFHFTAKDLHPNFKQVLKDCYSIWKCRIWFARYSKIPQDMENRKTLMLATE